MVSNFDKRVKLIYLTTSIRHFSICVCAFDMNQTLLLLTHGGRGVGSTYILTHGGRGVGSTYILTHGGRGGGQTVENQGRMVSHRSLI